MAKADKQSEYRGGSVGQAVRFPVKSFAEIRKTFGLPRRLEKEVHLASRCVTDK